jgi:hypothetical protein
MRSRTVETPLDYPVEAIRIEARPVSEAQPTRVETPYNEREEPVEVRNYDADGILASRTKITRDERGNVLEESVHVYRNTLDLFRFCFLEKPDSSVVMETGHFHLLITDEDTGPEKS